MQKSRVAALVLCFFLGALGVHRFYVGKVGSGIAQLLLCWTGISAIWAFIDFIMICVGSFTDGNGNKLV